ncbi:hypothetical protein MLD38_023353 [Melastoma candidum]|uniref:Uncharacterized protein n=1 Tax=Melastoma candidum TaxID=119954 RepID=A0ACB9QMT8_9MYRT|nr:hypothetical protein MLD38_023353 [Melastoma candidum]
MFLVVGIHLFKSFVLCSGKRHFEFGARTHRARGVRPLKPGGSEEKAEMMTSFLKAYLPCFRSDKRMLVCDEFVRSLNHRLPKRMILQRKGIPDGRKNWHVKLINLNGHVYIQGGWLRFSRDNHLEDGDILAFHYIRGLAFQIRVFGKNMCEKQVVQDIPSDDTSEDNDVDDDKEEEGDWMAEEVPAFKHNQKAHGKRKVGNGGSRSTLPSWEYFPDVEKYIDVRNPFFVTRLRNNRKNCLPVPWHFNGDYNLKLAAPVTFEDPLGRRSKGEIKNWNDGRIWISGWGAVCRRNNIGPEDAIICEFPQVEGAGVHVIKIHTVPGAGRRMSGPSRDSI